VRALATSLTPSGKRRLWRGHPGEQPCSETRAPVLFALRTAADKGMMALTRRLVRVELAGLGFGLGGTAATGLGWRRRAAQQAEAMHRPRLRALPVPQGQLDERGHVIARQPTGATDATGARGPESADGRQGVWSSGAPALRLMSAAIGGPRPRETAQAVGAATQARVAGLPACLREGVTGSLAALRAAVHVVTTCARPGKRGRPRQPRGAPQPALGDGPWVTPKQPGTRLTRRTRGGLGAERLTPWGCPRSPAWVERVPWTVRQALAPLARQPASGCQDRAWMRQRVVCCPAFDHRARPPMRVRQPLPPHARQGQGAMRLRWPERTPALAAGLADHVWALRALRTTQCEP